MVKFKFDYRTRYYVRNLADILFHAYKNQQDRIWTKVMEQTIKQISTMIEVHMGPNQISRNEEWIEWVDFECPLHLSAIEMAIEKAIQELK